MTGTYARNTEVDVGKSRAEIERTLERYGATAFGYASEPGRAMVQFVKNGRTIRFILPLPDRQSREFTHHSNGPRTATAAADLYEKAVRQPWRALALMVKAKLEGVESGIVTFEAEFASHTVMANGHTLYENIEVELAQAVASGRMPTTLLAIGGSADDRH